MRTLARSACSCLTRYSCRSRDGSSDAAGIAPACWIARAASASMSASGRFWRSDSAFHSGGPVVGVHVRGVVLPDGQHQLHVLFGDRIHRRIGLAARRRGRERHEADRDPRCAPHLSHPRTRRRRFLEADEHRLAAFGARAEHHPLRFDAHQFRRLQVEDDRHRPANQRFRLVRLGNAGDNRALVESRYPRRASTACSISARVRRSAPWRREARPS